MKMPAQVVTKAVGSTFGKKLFSTIAFFFKWRMLALFLTVLLVHAIVISIQAQDVTPGIEELGARFLMPTIKLQNISLEIIEREGFYVRAGNNIFSDIWNAGSAYILYIAQFWIILMWITVLAFVVSISPWSNDSERFKNYLGGILLFFAVQWIFILMNKEPDLNLMSPILAFKDVLIAFPYVFQPFVDIVERWYPLKK